MTAEHQDRPPASEPFKVGFETYLSPFTYRYGSPEMRTVWSQTNFWTKVRGIWIAVAEVQQEAGLASQEQVADLKDHASQLSVERIWQLERDPKSGTGHDVAAAIAEYSEVARIGGEILHQGLTSEDTLSNAEVMQVLESFGIIRPKLISVLDAFGQKIDQYKDLVCMGYTHLQAAEPTTMGYRFARYAQDLLADLKLLDFVALSIKGKGIKGAVGTSASFTELLEGTGMTPEEHERKIMKRLGVDFVLVSDQTYPRKFLLLTESALANIGQSLHHFALDLQILQSSFVDEVAEPRRKGQVGSSAMPHKQNPIQSENVDSLIEVLPGPFISAWMTGAFVTLERTLRDSAGKRSWLPESFLIIDEALGRAGRIVRGLSVHENSVRNNLEKFAPFTVSEVILSLLSKAGMNRQEAHAILVEHAETAVEAKRSGEPNPMKELLLADERIVGVLGKEKVKHAFEDILCHVGNASQRCSEFLERELYPAIR